MSGVVPAASVGAYDWKHGLRVICEVCGASRNVYCDVSADPSATRPSGSDVDEYLHRARIAAGNDRARTYAAIVRYKLVELDRTVPASLDTFVTEDEHDVIFNPWWDSSGTYRVDPVVEYGATGAAFVARHPQSQAELGDKTRAGYVRLDRLDNVTATGWTTLVPKVGAARLEFMLCLDDERLLVVARVDAGDGVRAPYWIETMPEANFRCQKRGQALLALLLDVARWEGLLPDDDRAKAGHRLDRLLAAFDDGADNGEEAIIALKRATGVTGG